MSQTYGPGVDAGATPQSTCKVPFKQCKSPISPACPSGYCDNCCRNSCPTHRTSFTLPTISTSSTSRNDAEPSTSSRIAVTPRKPARSPYKSPLAQYLEQYLPGDDMDELYPSLPPEIRRSSAQELYPADSTIPPNEYYEFAASRSVTATAFPRLHPFGRSGKRLIALPPLKPNVGHSQNVGFLWAEKRVSPGSELIRDYSYTHPLWGPVNGKYNAQVDPQRVVYALRQKLAVVTAEREKSEGILARACSEVRLLSGTVSELAVIADKAAFELTHATYGTDELVKSAEIAAENARHATAVLAEANSNAEKLRSATQLIIDRESLLTELIYAFSAEAEIGHVFCINGNPSTLLSPGAKPLQFDAQAIDEYVQVIDLGVSVSEALQAETDQDGEVSSKTLSIVENARKACVATGLENMHLPPTSSYEESRITGRPFAPVNFPLSDAVRKACSIRSSELKRFKEWPMSVEEATGDLFANLGPFHIRNNLQCPLCKRGLTPNGMRIHVRQHRIAFFVSPMLRKRYTEFVEAKTNLPFDIDAALSQTINPEDAAELSGFGIIDKHAEAILRKLGVEPPEKVQLPPLNIPVRESLRQRPPSPQPTQVHPVTISSFQTPVRRIPDDKEGKMKSPQPRRTEVMRHENLTRSHQIGSPEVVRRYAKVASEYLKSGKSANEKNSSGSQGFKSTESQFLSPQESSESKLAARMGMSLAEFNLIPEQERKSLSQGNAYDEDEFYSGEYLKGKKSLTDMSNSKGSSSRRRKKDELSELDDNDDMNGNKDDFEDDQEENQEDDEQDDVCCVCNEGESEEGNEIVFCDGKCKLAYHQLCLGVRTLPDDEWLCPNCCSNPQEVYSADFIAVAATALEQAKLRKQGLAMNRSKENDGIGGSMLALRPYPPPPKSNAAVNFSGDKIDLFDLSLELHTATDLWAACESYFDHSLYETSAWLANLLPSQDSKFYHSLPGAPQIEEIEDDVESEALANSIPADQSKDGDFLTEGGMMMLSYSGTRRRKKTKTIRNADKPEQNLASLPKLSKDLHLEVRSEKAQDPKLTVVIPSANDDEVSPSNDPMLTPRFDPKEVRMPIFKATLLADILAFNFNSSEVEKNEELDYATSCMQILPGLSNTDGPTNAIAPSFIIRIPLVEFKKRQGGMPISIRRRIEMEQVKMAATRWHRSQYPEMYTQTNELATGRSYSKQVNASPLEESNSNKNIAETPAYSPSASPIPIGITPTSGYLPTKYSEVSRFPQPLPLSEMTFDLVMTPGDIASSTTNSQAANAAKSAAQAQAASSNALSARRRARRSKFATVRRLRRNQTDQRAKYMDGENEEDIDEEEEDDEIADEEAPPSVLPPSDELSAGIAAGIEAAWRLVRPLPTAAAADPCSLDPAKRGLVLNRHLKSGEMSLFTLPCFLPGNTRVKWDWPSGIYEPQQGYVAIDPFAYALYTRGLFPMGFPNPNFGNSISCSRAGSHLLSARIKSDRSSDFGNVTVFGTMLNTMMGSGVVTDALAHTLSHIRMCMSSKNPDTQSTKEQLRKLYANLLEEFRNDAKLLNYLTRWTEYALTQVPPTSVIARIPALTPPPPVLRWALFEAVKRGTFQKYVWRSSNDENDPYMQEGDANLRVIRSQGTLQVNTIHHIAAEVAHESIARTSGLFGIPLSSRSWITMVPLALTKLPEDDYLQRTFPLSTANPKGSFLPLAPLDVQHIHRIRNAEFEGARSRRSRQKLRPTSQRRRIQDDDEMIRYNDGYGSESDGDDNSYARKTRGRPKSVQKSRKDLLSPVRTRGKARRYDMDPLLEQDSYQLGEQPSDEELDDIVNSISDSVLQQSFESMREKMSIKHDYENLLQPDTSTLGKKPPQEVSSSKWIRFEVSDEYTRLISLLAKPTALPSPSVDTEMSTTCKALLSLKGENFDEKSKLSNAAQATSKALQMKDWSKVSREAEKRRSDLAKKRRDDPKWSRKAGEAIESLCSLPAPVPQEFKKSGALSERELAQEHFGPITICPFLCAPSVEEVKDSLSKTFFAPEKKEAMRVKSVSSELAEWEELFGSNHDLESTPLAVKNIIEDMLQGKIPAQGVFAHAPKQSKISARNDPKSTKNVDSFMAAKNAAALWVSPASFECYHTDSTETKPDGSVKWAHEGVLLKVIAELEEAIQKTYAPLLDAFSKDSEVTVVTQKETHKQFISNGLEDVGLLFKPRQVESNSTLAPESPMHYEALESALSDDRTLFTYILKEFAALRDPTFDESYAADATPLDEEMWLLSRQLTVQQLANNSLKLKSARRMLEIIRSAVNKNPIKMKVLPVTWRSRSDDLFSGNDGILGTEAICEPIDVSVPPGLLANLATNFSPTFSLDGAITGVRSRDRGLTRDVNFKSLGGSRNQFNQGSIANIGHALSEFEGPLSGAIASQLHKVYAPRFEGDGAKSNLVSSQHHLPDYCNRAVDGVTPAMALVQKQAVSAVLPDIKIRMDRENCPVNLNSAKDYFGAQFMSEDEMKLFSASTPSMSSHGRCLIWPPHMSPYSSAPSQLYSPFDAVDVDVRVLEAARALDRTKLKRKTLDVRRKAALFRLQDPTVVAVEVASTLSSIVETVVSLLEHGHRPTSMNQSSIRQVRSTGVSALQHNVSKSEDNRRRTFSGEYGYSPELFMGSRYLSYVPEPPTRTLTPTSMLSREVALLLPNREIFHVTEEKFLQLRSIAILARAGFTEGRRPIAARKWVMSPAVGSTLLRFPTPFSVYLEKCLPDTDKFSATGQQKTRIRTLHDAIQTNGKFGFARGLTLHQLNAAGFTLRVFADPLSTTGRSEPFLVSSLEIEQSTKGTYEVSSMKDGPAQSSANSNISTYGSTCLRQAYCEAESIHHPLLRGECFWKPTPSFARLSQEEAAEKALQLSVWSSPRLSAPTDRAELTGICTCKQILANPLLIACDTCNFWFHVDCSGQDDRTGVNRPLDLVHVAAVSRWDCPTCCSLIMTSQRQPAAATSSFSSGTTPLLLSKRFEMEKASWRRMRMRELFFDLGIELMDPELKTLIKCAEIQMRHQLSAKRSQKPKQGSDKEKDLSDEQESPLDKISFAETGPIDLLRAQSALDLDATSRANAFGIRMPVPCVTAQAVIPNSKSESATSEVKNLADALNVYVQENLDAPLPEIDTTKGKIALMKLYGLSTPDSLEMADAFESAFKGLGNIEQTLQKMRDEAEAAEAAPFEDIVVDDDNDEGYDGAGLDFDEETMAERRKFIRMDKIWRSHEHRFDQETLKVPDMYPYGIKLVISRKKKQQPNNESHQYSFKGIYHGRNKVDVRQYMESLSMFATPTSLLLEFAELWPIVERDKEAIVVPAVGEEEDEPDDVASVRSSNEDASWDDFFNTYQGPYQYPRKVRQLPVKINKWRSGVIARMPPQVQIRAKNYAKKWLSVYITGMHNEEYPDEPDEYFDEPPNLACIDQKMSEDLSRVKRVRLTAVSTEDEVRMDKMDDSLSHGLFPSPLPVDKGDQQEVKHDDKTEIQEGAPRSSKSQATRSALHSPPKQKRVESATTTQTSTPSRSSARLALTTNTPTTSKPLDTVPEESTTSRKKRR